MDAEQYHNAQIVGTIRMSVNTVKPDMVKMGISVLHVQSVTVRLVAMIITSVISVSMGLEG